ncbi:hypothetical protein HY483_04190 [Candidatus Woesearchaeota archaeon]|nr:hypothetical protein [Candidatus Woesearchaeota archaeon]
MNKKGLSPLLATIILIVVSVGLGAVVMSWGENYIEQQAKFVQASGKSELALCEGVSIKIVSTSAGQKSCRGQDFIEVFVENPTGKPVDGFYYNIIGEDTSSQKIQQSISRGEVKKITIQTTLKKIELVKLTPVIGSTNCAEKSIKIEKLKTCE